MKIDKEIWTVEHVVFYMGDDGCAYIEGVDDEMSTEELVDSLNHMQSSLEDSAKREATLEAECERLKEENALYCPECLKVERDKLRADLEAAIKERDSARREVCRLLAEGYRYDLSTGKYRAMCGLASPEDVAEMNGWHDIFEGGE